MHLNHLLLATALALFINSDAVVTAGKPDSIATQVEQVDPVEQVDHVEQVDPVEQVDHVEQDDHHGGKNATGPEQAAVIPVKVPTEKVLVEEDPSEEGPTEKMLATKGGAIIGVGLGEESDEGDSWDRSDDSDLLDASGSGDDSSEWEDASGSSEDASESEDASGSNADASESGESDSGSALDDLFSSSGSEDFDAWLKSLKDLGLASDESGSDEDAIGSEEPTKAPKKTKEADSSASEMMNFDDFFADMKGSGFGGGFGALMGTPAPETAAESEASGSAKSGSDQSQNATPQCDEGKWSRFKAWWGKWLHITTDKDCPEDTPSPDTPASAKLRPD